MDNQFEEAVVSAEAVASAEEQAALTAAEEERLLAEEVRILETRGTTGLATTYEEVKELVANNFELHTKELAIITHEIVKLNAAAKSHKKAEKQLAKLSAAEAKKAEREAKLAARQAEILAKAKEKEEQLAKLKEESEQRMAPAAATLPSANGISAKVAFAQEGDEQPDLFPSEQV